MKSSLLVVDIVDQCACRYEDEDPTANLPKVLMTTTLIIVEVGGKNSPTL